MLLAIFEKTQLGRASIHRPAGKRRDIQLTSSYSRESTTSGDQIKITAFDDQGELDSAGPEEQLRRLSRFPRQRPYSSLN